MKKQTRYFFLLPFLMSSCLVFNSGNVGSGPLLNVNDKYVDIAMGESQSITALFFAWEYSNKMLLDAKMDLFKNRPLRKGEYYSNFSCDISKKVILGIVYITRVTVSAEVLKTSEPNAKPRDEMVMKPTDPAFNNFIGLLHPANYFVNKIDTFVLGEKVYYRAKNQFRSFLITAINGNEVSLKYCYGNGGTIQAPADKILYSTKKSLNGYSVGERVALNQHSFGSKMVTIVAISDQRVLVQDKTGFFSSAISNLKREP